MSSKRKRSNPPVGAAEPRTTIKTTTSSSLLPPVALGPKAVNLQVIAGSYDKVLHGFIASVPITFLPIPNGRRTPSKIMKHQMKFFFDINNHIVLGQVGGREMGMVSRVKDFAILEADVPSEGDKPIRVITRLSSQSLQDLMAQSGFGSCTLNNLKPRSNVSLDPPNKKLKTTEPLAAVAARNVSQLGSLLGIYETGRRITCLSGMVMSEGWNIEDEPKIAEKIMTMIVIAAKMSKQFATFTVYFYI